MSDIDLEAGVIRVRGGRADQGGAQPTKTKAGERDVPLSGRVRAELARHKLATGRSGDDLLFGRTSRDAFVRSTLRARALRAWDGNSGRTRDPKASPRMVWVNTTDDALDPLTPHEARHSCASYLSAAGVTPKEVQEAMGHADIRTTLNVYAKAVPGWQEGAAATRRLPGQRSGLRASSVCGYGRQPMAIEEELVGVTLIREDLRLLLVAASIYQDQLVQERGHDDPRLRLAIDRISATASSAEWQPKPKRD